MYSREKSLKRDQSRRNPPLSSTQLPSFSSTLLDEIYSSIDGVKSDGFKQMKQSHVQDEETANLRRSRLVEKWMEKKLVHDKTSTRRRQSLPGYHHGPMLFIPSSSSSDSSSGGDMGSPAVYKQRASCFTGAAPSLMRIKTTVSNQPEDKSPKSSEAKPKEKISALKMYNNLKMMKQLPVSPGTRFTNFFNTLFRHGNSKKSTKQSNTNFALTVEKDSKSTQDSSTCSSAASYYRSCLTKKTSTSVNPRRPNEPNNNNNGGKTKRTVRFNPVSVIVDDDGYCGNDSDKFARRITYPRNSNRKLVDMRSYSCEEDEEEEEEDNEDDDSDTSSDLFELDHLTFMGSYRDSRNNS